MHANAGLALHDEVFRPHEQRDFFAYGLAAEGRLGPGLSLVGEWAGLAGKGQPGADAHSELRAGVRLGLGPPPRRCGAEAGAAGRRRDVGPYGRGDLAAALTAASRAMRTAAYSISRRTISGSVSSPAAWAFSSTWRLRAAMRRAPMIPQLPLSEWAENVSPSAVAVEDGAAHAARVPLDRVHEVADELVHEAGHVGAQGGEASDDGGVEGRRSGVSPWCPGKDA